MTLFLINSLVPRSAVEVCEAVSEGRTVVLVEGEGRASSILVASLGRKGLLNQSFGSAEKNFFFVMKNYNLPSPRPP
jgi:hypothetical protein